MHIVQVFKPHQPIQPANNHRRPPISRAIKVLRMKRHPVAVTGNYSAAVSTLLLIPTKTYPYLSRDFPSTHRASLLLSSRLICGAADRRAGIKRVKLRGKDARGKNP